ncbi:MAG: hypothetical protein ACYCYP_11930 [Leptospirales bacterium]
MGPDHERLGLRKSLPKNISGTSFRGGFMSVSREARFNPSWVHSGFRWGVSPSGLYRKRMKAIQHLLSHLGVDEPSLSA